MGSLRRIRSRLQALRTSHARPYTPICAAFLCGYAPTYAHAQEHARTRTRSHARTYTGTRGMAGEKVIGTPSPLHSKLLSTSLPLPIRAAKQWYHEKRGVSRAEQGLRRVERRQFLQDLKVRLAESVDSPVGGTPSFLDFVKFGVKSLAKACPQKTKIGVPN